MNTTRKHWIAVAASALLLAAGVFMVTGRGKTTTAATAPAPPDVEVAAVQQSDACARNCNGFSATAATSPLHCREFDLFCERRRRSNRSGGWRD